MKICLVTHTIPRYYGDPAAPFIDALASALADAGHKVTVLAPFSQKVDRNFKRNYKFITYKYIFPASLHKLGYSETLKGDRSMSFLAYLLSPFLYLFGFIALLRLVKKENIDVISAHWAVPNGFITALVSIITKVPFTITIPGSDMYMGEKNFFFRWMVGVAAKHASFVISDSPFYLGQLAHLGFKPKKSMVIRYGVDISRFRLGREKRKERQTILAVGRMVAKKGFTFLVKAMPKVISEFPSAKLIMVGDGEERMRLEQVAKSLGVKENIDFIGTVPFTKLSEYYQSADIFVMPSIKDDRGNIDASPVSMMEAMVSGLPVVTTRFGGSKDLILQGRTGYLVEEKSHEEIASAVIKLLKAKIDKRRVREIAVANFSSRSIAARYIGVFRDIIYKHKTV